jgi:hypothetical protein
MKKLSVAGISLLYLSGVIMVSFCLAITMFGHQGEDRNERTGTYMSFDHR